ncbi:MAG: hypothetical protein NTW56_14130 [Alphaproteobacteria bacterium]|nr:hypothetical protein [Alphaproteobacteria bacterium]
MQDPPDLSQLAEDWITLWQSELAAMAADPELAEAWAASVALAAAFWRAQGRVYPLRWPRHDAADAPPRPAPAGTAPDGQRDARDGGDDLRARITELERRLADLAAGAPRSGADPKRGRRPRRQP